MSQILEISGADVRYFGGVTPPRLLRIAADEDGVMAYSAEPSWPTWETDFEALFDLAKDLDETIFEISKAEAIFLLYNWGGQHDALDHPDADEPQSPRFIEQEDADIGLAREDALRELRGLGTKVNVVPPLVDSSPPPPPAPQQAIDRSA